MSDDDELERLTGAWALDAVDDDERAALEARLADDDELRTEADELREVAGLLGEASAERPPPGLRDAILAEVAATPQEAAPVEDARVADAERSADVVPLRRWSRTRVAAGLAAAAAVVVVALVGASVLGGDDEVPAEIAAVVDDPAAVVVELDGELGPLRLVVSEREQAAVVRGDDVAVPAGDRTYQLWELGDDGTITPSELFRPDDDGSLEVRLDGVGPGPAFAVSEEPAGGSPQPTGDIVANTI
ncbi:MAG: anti-sigma factor [Actinomycetota bacterium]